MADGDVAGKGAVTYRDPMRDVLRKRPWLIPAAIGILAALFAASHIIGDAAVRGTPHHPSDVIRIASNWLLFGLLSPFIFRITKKWPLEWPVFRRPLLIHLACAGCFAFLWATGRRVVELITAIVFQYNVPKAMALMRPDALLSWAIYWTPLGIVGYLSVAGMASAIHYALVASERQTQLARMAEGLERARFASLQAQLNPHFLFNALNTIAVRARDADTEGTARMVEQLSSILRRTLAQGPADEAPLEDELDLIREYLSIEEARFADRLHPVFAVEPNVLSAGIPPFSVQHLVENAVRHGLNGTDGQVSVTISARRIDGAIEIVVADTGRGAASERLRKPAGGLENTRARLRALYGQRGSLRVEGSDAGTTATLSVPYHPIRRGNGR